MERLHLKVARLETLWSCLGSCVDPVSVGDKLKYVLLELDKVIEYEEWRKQVLSADIEDIMASIECGCQLLGIAMDSLLSSTMDQDGMIGTYDWELFDTKCVMPPTSDRKKTLTILNNRLADEIRQRRTHIKEWLADIDALCMELGLPHPFDSGKSYHDDLCWATVQKISCALRDLTQKQTSNKIRFERLVHSIHYYQTVLGESINGDCPIDIALHNLCNNATLNSPFDMYQQPKTDNDNTNNDLCSSTFLYYRHPLPYPLSLQDDLMTTLENKAHDLQALYNTRMAQFNHLSNSLETLWNELKVPVEKQCIIYPSLHKGDLDKLQQNFDKMKTIVRTMTDEYIDTIREDLTRLWDACLLTQIERDEFLASLYHKANTMDTVRMMIDKHMEYLEYIQSSSRTVDTIMKERKELIQKMIQFETSASDPKRLFQASFQLMEEERWRKTCFPTLLQLDDALIKAVHEFESISEKYFMVGNRRYLDILLDEIADRTANQTFFGFLNTEPNHDRLVRSKYRPNALSFNSHSGTTNKKASKTPPSLCESPTQGIPPTNDIQPQTRLTSKRRPSPISNKSTITRDTHTDTFSSLLPSSSTSAKRIQASPSLSTRSKKHHDIRKRLSNQNIPTQKINVIPEQCKSKSYPVSSSNKNSIKKDDSIPSQVPLDNNSKKRSTVVPNDVITPPPSTHHSPPLSPISLSPPRSKASQIPILRAYTASNRSSPSSPTTTAQQEQQQQQLTVRCA